MVTNFSELFQKYAQDVYRFAYWLCGDEQEAEDITAETFLRALTAAGRIEAETVKGYLLTIAKNLAYKRANQKKRHSPLDPKLQSAANSPEREAEVNLKLQGVMRFIQTLPEIDRAALLMHAQDEMPYEEIADVLGISLSAAKVKVHRARLKLAAYRLQQEV